MQPDLGLDVGSLYLDWALGLEIDGEQELRRRLLDRLPPAVVDVHAHLNGPDAAHGYSDFGWAQRRSSFPRWSINDSRTIDNLLYGDRRIVRLWMPQPHAGIDHREANRYVLANSSDRDIPMVCAVLDDSSYTEQLVRSGAFVGVKSYPHAVEPAYQHILDFFPHWLLDCAEQEGTPIVLHTPTPISECWQELAEILETHLDLKVVLAHLGREATSSSELQRALEVLGDYDRVVADVSMSTHSDVYDLAFEALGTRRVLFGSDEPFNLLRYREVVDPDYGRKVVSSQAYHWNKSWAIERYGELTHDAPLIHFQVLEELFGAIDRLVEPADEVVTNVFANNAVRFFGLDAVI